MHFPDASTTNKIALNAIARLSPGFATNVSRKCQEIKISIRKYYEIVGNIKDYYEIAGI